MDRFARTREHYMRCAPRREPQTEEPLPAAPSEPANIPFDFDFSKPKLDLGVGASTPPREEQSQEITRHEQSVSDQIGIAISSNLRSVSRDRSPIKTFCTSAMAEQAKSSTVPNDNITPVPFIPKDMHTRFSSPTNTDSKKPSCSIYSKDCRRRARQAITPPGRAECEGYVKPAHHLQKKPSFTQAESPNLTNADNTSDRGKSPLPGKGFSAVANKQTNR